ncbi:MAG: tetratricopeptide repeat protein [Fimbriimonadaceae bacterium]|nr:tetratricopeptide repeat protein [Chitinophagales bacterium]
MKIKTFKLLIALFAFQFVHAQNIDYAKQLIVSEKYNDAVKVLNALKSNADQAATANYYLGNIYFKKGIVDSAKLFYSQIPEGDRDFTSLLSRGRLALLRNDAASAKTFFDKAVQVTKSKNAEVLYEVGDAYVTPKPTNLTEAIGYLAGAVALSPQNAVYYLRLGDAHLANKDAGKALSQYENAVSFNDKFSPAWLNMARINSNAHLFSVSAGNYEKYLALEPGNPIAWKEYGENLYYAGRYSEVEAAFVRYIELNDNDKEAQLDVCILKYTFGKYDEAITCSKDYLLKDSTNYIAWRIISWSNYELKNYKEGYDASMKFWSIDEKKVNPNDYIYSARLAAQNKDTVRTIFFYEQGLQSDSVNAELYSEYGKALFNLRKWEDVTKIFEAKDSIYGNGSIDVFYLGRAYYNMNNYLKADSSFTVFAEKQPTSPDGYLWRAKSNSSMDTVDFKGLAFPHYDKYIEIAQADTVKNKANLIDAYIYMARYNYELKKDNKKSCEFIRKALELDPENAFSKEMMDLLKC